MIIKDIASVSDIFRKIRDINVVNHHRLARIACLLNYFILISFFFDQQPEYFLTEMILQMVPRFDKVRDVTLAVFYPILKG